MHSDALPVDAATDTNTDTFRHGSQRSLVTFQLHSKNGPTHPAIIIHFKLELVKEQILRRLIGFEKLRQNQAFCSSLEVSYMTEWYY